jgi:succinate-acetate transporter protein
MTIRIDSNENRCVTTSTVGYMCLALTLWMASMTTAGWYDRMYAHGTALLLPMALGLGVMGILAHLRSRSLDAVVFLGSALLLWSAHSASAMGAGEPSSYTGWYWAVWAVFFGYVWLGSFHAPLPRQLFLLGLTLLLLCGALHLWTQLAFFRVIGGYIGLITALLAALVSASGFIAFGQEMQNPNDDHQAASQQPHAA